MANGDEKEISDGGLPEDVGKSVGDVSGDPEIKEEESGIAAVESAVSRNIELVLTDFSEKLESAILAYCEIIQIDPGFDLKAALKIAIENALGQEEVVLPEGSIPCHQHPLFRPVLRELSLVAAKEMQSKFMEGDLPGAVRCLITSFECARIAGFGIPISVFECYGKIEGESISGGKLEQIFLKAKELLYPSAGELREPKDRAKSVYSASVGTDVLEKLLSELQEKKNWNGVIAVLEELIERKKDVLNNRIILSYAFERAGRIVDALNLCNLILTFLFEGSKPYKENQAHIKELREKLALEVSKAGKDS